jgi:serum/glucocorticoid-regulated kinase 2
MLTGYPPFYTNNLKTLLNNIRYQKLIIPSNISQGARNILVKMLEKNPESRIGGKNISVLKKHIFFAEINWEKLLLRKLMPPSLVPRTYN